MSQTIPEMQVAENPANGRKIYVVIMGMLTLFGFVTITYAALDHHKVPVPLVHGVLYPVNYHADFVHYLTVERIDGTIRDIYISPAAARFRPGLPLPENTVIVVEGYYAAENERGKFLKDNAGRFIKGEPFEQIHVLEKRSDWVDIDFPGDVRAGDWNFGSFDVNTGENFDESLTACFHCHRPTGNTDFVYTYSQLVDYTVDKDTQYFFCNLSNRVPC